MSKMRVHELAKELGRSNKEIMDFLAKRGIEVKSHMTVLEDAQVDLVQKSVGVRPAPPKREAEPEAEGTRRPEPQKKKNITRIFRSQNSRTGIQKPAGMRTIDDQPKRPAGRPGQRPPMRPGAGTSQVPPQGQMRPQAQGQVPQGQAGQMPQGQARPQGQGQVPQGQAGQMPQGQMRPQGQGQAPQGQAGQMPQGQARPQGQVQVPQGQAGQMPQGQARPQGQGQVPQGQARSQGQGQVPQGQAGQMPQGQARPQGQVPQGQARPQGQGQAPQGQARPQGQGQAPQGQARPQGQGQAAQAGQATQRRTRPQGQAQQRRQGEAGQTARTPQQGSGSRDGRTPRGTERTGRDGRDGRDSRGIGRDNRGAATRNGRPGEGFGRGTGRPMGSKLAIPQADTSAKSMAKESRNRTDKEKDKEKYNKRDRLDRQERGQQGRSGAKGGNTAKNAKNAKNTKTTRPTKPAGKGAKPAPAPQPEKKVNEIRTITLPERLTVRELADLLKVQPAAIVKKLFMQGVMVTVNHEIEYAQAEEIALEYNCITEPEEKVDVIAELLKDTEDKEETLVARPPVVCVMGHVDHGKTSLLDAIRNTHVIAKEAGGITQHIGAYMVSANGQKITFLDTPGHEAFTAMRMRGANATDIAILVVAADDGVMPQTVEAISHAKAAGTEIIVAINKIDKPGANIDRVKQELSEQGLVPEDWGGNTVFVPVSARTHEGLDNLLEMILLTAEVMELRANPNRNARGLVIEAELDRGKGPVATVLVQKGTLRVGDNVAAGACYGKVRAMIDDQGRRIKEAGPSTPVEILGLSDVPNAGEVFVECENDREARSFAETFIGQNKEKLLQETKSRMSLDELFDQIQAGNVKELNLIIKADVQGSVEAVKQSLVKLSGDEVAVRVIHGGVGAINESDVSLASASNAIIIGFNVRPDVMAKATAEREGVDIRLYRVIYDAIADVEAALKGMLDPVFEEKIIGHAEVRQIFKASGVGTIAGSYVLDGVFQRNCLIRITREGKLIYEGALASLKRFKDDVKEVRAGYECGLVFEKFNDVQELDQIEAHIMVEVPR